MECVKLAIQKSGRLSKESIDLLKNSGIKIEEGKDKLKVKAQNFPIEILYLRNSDIPKCIEGGVADLGIIGENSYLENGLNHTICRKLDFGKCRLSLAVPKELNYNEKSFFNGKKIATSYPNILKKWLDKESVSAKIHEISGSVEIAPSIGLADAVCDIVSTGNTLFTNGLKEVETICSSQAVLIQSNSLSKEKQSILEKLLFRIDSILRSKQNKYILLNIPNDKVQDLSKVLPAMNSPSVMPLAKTGWSSVHTVIEAERFWEVIDELKYIGAEGILIAPIEKMVR